MTIELPHIKTGMALLLLTVILLLLWVLIRRMHSAKSNINLDDLLIDPLTNKISKAAAVLMASFGIASWVILYLTLTGKLTEVLFSAYLLTYAAPAVTKIITDARTAAAGAST